jgi:antitoxin (DNA-binding transcriptional repressor) of toxin-antitoxin stability system
MVEHQSTSRSPRGVSLGEFRKNLTSILKQIHDGHRFVLTSHDKIVAEIGPTSRDIAVRKPGTLRGRIKLSEDFDVQPPDIQAMEDGT